MADAKDLKASMDEVASKLNIDIDWLRGFTAEDILWLLDRCPFLQMINTVISSEPQGEMKIVTAQSSGWDIHVYPDAMSSSPGRFLMGGGYFAIGEDDEDEDGGGGGKVVNPGKGTIFNQAIMTAMEMVTMAQELGWEGIQIVDGHSRMMRGAWIKASELGMPVQGFEPSSQDHKVLERVQMSAAEMQNLFAEVTSKTAPKR